MYTGGWFTKRLLICVAILAFAGQVPAADVTGEQVVSDKLVLVIGAAGHLVYSSVASVNRDTGIPHFNSKQEIEIYIRESGVDHTIIRPVSFMQNWAGARSMIAAEDLRTPQRPESETYLVSTRDIGRLAAEAFDIPC